MNLREDLSSLLAQYLPEGSGEKLDAWARQLAQMPCRNTTALVGLSTLVFYLAERGRNPKVNDIFDAMVYTSTCLSVGYSDIFAKTPIGKMIGSTLMTYGPSLTAKTMDAPGDAERDALQAEMLHTLKEILARLDSSTSSTPSNAVPARDPSDESI